MVPTQFVDDFVIQSPSALGEVLSRLTLAPHRVIESTDSGMVFEVGIDGFPSGTVAVTVQPLGDVTEIRGEITFHASGSAVADAVAYRMCTRFENELLGLLKLFGGEAASVQTEGGDQ
jgi:hypothetical protein